MFKIIITQKCHRTIVYVEKVKVSLIVSKQRWWESFALTFFIVSFHWVNEELLFFTSRRQTKFFQRKNKNCENGFSSRIEKLEENPLSNLNKLIKIVAKIVCTTSNYPKGHCRDDGNKPGNFLLNWKILLNFYGHS